MTQSLPSAVVFDLGGVLIDWNPRYLYRKLFASQADMEDFLARVCTLSWHHTHDLGADMTESCRRLARLHPGHRDMIMAWVERYEEMTAGPVDGTVRLLAELKAGGMRCVALSNMPAPTFAAYRARFGFLDWFDGQVISGQEGLAKPDPRIFKLLLRRYRLEPSAVVFIDDTQVNVEVARACGMRALHFTGARQLRCDLRSLGLTLGPS